jgi:hypothetical protein
MDTEPCGQGCAPMSHNKSPLQSKKFVAFLLAEMTWKIITIVVLTLGMKNGTVDVKVAAIIMACVLIAGFVEAGYIIGQGSLDKYLGLAQIAAQSGQSLKVKGTEILKPAADSEEPNSDG